MEYNINHINKIIEDNNFQRIVNEGEARHAMQLEMLLKLIEYSHMQEMKVSSEAGVDAIMITGPSSSGKTIFTDRLQKELDQKGKNCHIISLDNYYKDRATITDGDYEKISAFDVSLFSENMKAFVKGESVDIPLYDFNKGARSDDKETISPKGNDILLIEGIQTFNPLLVKGVDFNRIFRIYICPFDIYASDKGVLFPWEMRFIRRSVRDSIKRNSPILKTMEMWPDVRKGEEEYIKPLKKYTDFFFNSSLEYELPLLKKAFIALVKDLGGEDKARLREFVNLDVLEDVSCYDKAEIPEESILNEFYL